MKVRFFVLGILVLLVALIGRLPFASAAPTLASPAADCESFGTGEGATGLAPLASLDFNFSCSTDAVVYFGTCDSGPIPDDDLFNITYNGTVVAYNFYEGGAEYAVIGTAAATAGSHTATLASINVGEAEATYSYAVSADSAAVTSYLSSFCGTDFAGPGVPAGIACYRDVSVFTEDTASSNGVLEFRIMLGNEDSRETSGLMQSWEITAGQRLNNVLVTNVPGPRYARLYWQPAGSGEWYMLTSQYWHNEGTKADEYGVACTYPAQASYHTSFASAVPVADVCFDLMKGCRR